jgi:hypothetical protein
MKKNEKDFPLLLYQRRDTVGLVHCNFSLTAVMQGGVCDTVQYAEKMNTDYL